MDEIKDTRDGRLSVANRSCPRVRVSCGFGSFDIEVDMTHAPFSGAYFLRDVDQGLLDGTSIFRIVRRHSHPPGHPAPIDVIQMGIYSTKPLPPLLTHEGTDRTGLRHTRGTVSLARFSPGGVYHSFFVCMRDEPSLDAGGLRNPDCLGFAAFGRVFSGMHVLERVFRSCAEAGEYLKRPIPLRQFRRHPDL